MRSVVALFVEEGGVYYNRRGVVPYGLSKDAREYVGPYRVVAHPPCKRWGRFWHGSTRKPHQFYLGADQGCFYAALWAVRTFGGVLEHPAHSQAWNWFGMVRPPLVGWSEPDAFGGRSCRVEQGFYGHFSNKATWLYACGTKFPKLRWGRGAQQLHPIALAKYGYEKARRIGMVAMVGGKDKEKIRDRTPPLFANVMLRIARS